MCTAPCGPWTAGSPRDLLHFEAVAVICALFGGQGEEHGRILSAPDAWTKTLRGFASEAVNDDIGELIRRGRFLSQAVLQPSIVAALLAAWGPTQADVAAGHSLGELAALAAVGAWTPKQAIFAASARGIAMATVAFPGGQVAVNALPDLLAWPDLALAGHVAPGVWTVSGPTEALRLYAAATGARPVAVSGPWHHPRMAAAAPLWRGALHTLVEPQGRWEPAHNLRLAPCEALLTQLGAPADWVGAATRAVLGADTTVAIGRRVWAPAGATRRYL